MKVTGGLVGIKLNTNARHQFFLISAELVGLAEETKQMTSDSVAARKCHNELPQAILKRHTKCAQTLVSTIKCFINPFSCPENDIINLVTKAVMPEKIKQDICRIEDVWVAKMETFIQERIKTEQENGWAPMQKFQLETWSAFLKKYM